MDWLMLLAIIAVAVSPGIIIGLGVQEKRENFRVQCRNAGGVPITPRGELPVCLKGAVYE